MALFLTNFDVPVLDNPRRTIEGEGLSILDCLTRTKKETDIFQEQSAQSSPASQASGRGHNVDFPQSPIAPSEFTLAMQRRWSDYSNSTSPQLIRLWAQMAATFNQAIKDSISGCTRWRVLQPPTGTGKTQGLCVYSALILQKNAASCEPLGMIIVTRTIAQADEIANTIRELAGEPEDTARVVARHSDNKITNVRMKNADVLVITHSAYTRALEGLNQAVTGHWEDYTSWLHGVDT